MAKPSRSKQPAFDPSELEDLILTPAVGSGVGSHLVRTDEPRLRVTSVATSEVATIVTSDEPRSRPDLPSVATSVTSWSTEAGDLVPQSRIKPIRAAEDALSEAERTVYEALWNGAFEPHPDAGEDRISQAGYDYLVRHTRLSRKTIQRVIDRLIEKEYITIEKPADIYQRTATVYRVYHERGILNRQAARGRFHVVKIGPGYLYVHPTHS
jgi:predicted transcriptional regulator